MYNMHMVHLKDIKFGKLVAICDVNWCMDIRFGDKGYPDHVRKS